MQATKAIAVPEKIDILINDAKREIIKALPDNVTENKFRSALITAVQNNHEILNVDPQSLHLALIKCATDGLIPDGKQAAIVPFKNKRKGIVEANYMPMVKGLIKRMHELGDVHSITSEAVYENDIFEVELSDPESTTHKMPENFGDRGKNIIAAYAIFRDREKRVKHREILTRTDIQQISRCSKRKKETWDVWPSEYARKSAIRRGSKYITMSEEAVRIIEREDEYYDLSALEHEGDKDRNPLIEDTAQVETAPQETASEAPELASESVEGEDAQKPEMGSPEHVLKAYKTMVDNCQSPDDLRALDTDKISKEIADLTDEMIAEAKKHRSEKIASFPDEAQS